MAQLCRRGYNSTMGQAGAAKPFHFCPRRTRGGKRETHVANIKIAGSGEAGGGRYDSVSIAGSGRLTGDVEARRVRVAGSGDVQGALRAGQVRSSGALRVSGTLDAEELRASGSVRVEGACRVGKARVSGSLIAGGPVQAGELRLAGSLEVGGDLDSRVCRVSGHLSVSGAVKAREAEIVINGDSSAAKIQADTLTVLRQCGSWQVFGLRWGEVKAALRADEIEGNELHLEAVSAQRVRGRRVRIGPHSTIELVEYSQSLQIDPTAKVSRHTFVGEGAAAPVAAEVERPAWGKDRRASSVLSWAARVAGREVRRPTARLALALAGLLVAAVAVGLVLFVALNVIGLAISVVFGVALMAVLVVVVGVPVLVLGAVLVRILLLPVEVVLRLARRR